MTAPLLSIVLKNIWQKIEKLGVQRTLESDWWNHTRKLKLMN